jgi:hypothetical protein
MRPKRLDFLSFGASLQNEKNMNKLVIISGLISGIIFIGSFFLFGPSGEEFDHSYFENGQLYGYITMIIALSTIFFAVKQYRDKELGGKIKFGKAFLIGLYITLIASVCYVLGWELYTTTSNFNFAEAYVAFQESQLAEQGMSEDEIASQMADQKQMMEMYQDNTAFRLGITFTEIFPVGLLISLVCALIFGVILKPKAPQGVGS